MEIKTAEYCKQSVFEGSKSIYSANLVDFGEGNVSMRFGDKDEFMITPTRNDYAALTTNDIVHLTFNGVQISDGRSASSEYRLHSIIYQKRPNAKCIIHTHSIYATILSVVKQKIPILLEEMLLFLGGEINVADYSEAGTFNIGLNAYEAMGLTNGVLMTNHGVLVCGRSMEHAVKNAKLVEKLAHIYYGALNIGNIHTVPKEKWQKYLEYFEEDYSTI